MSRKKLYTIEIQFTPKSEIGSKLSCLYDLLFDEDIKPDEDITLEDQLAVSSDQDIFTSLTQAR